MPTATNHKVFCAFGAYAVNVIDPKAIVVVPLADAHHAELNLKKGILVTLDFTQRLGVAAWNDVILDDIGLETPKAAKSRFFGLQRPHDDPGFNVLTIGPEFPGPQWGGIYLEHDLFSTQVLPLLRNTPPGWPAYGRPSYELMSSAALNGTQIRRYHGFHATVRGRQSTSTDLDISYQSLNGPANVTARVNLNDRDQCDDPTLLGRVIGSPSPLGGPAKRLTASSLAGDSGAVFLELSLCVKLGLRGPKEPPGG